MARLVFPNDPLAYGVSGNAMSSAVGSQVTVYTDAAGTLLADIQTLANAAIVGSVLTVDSNSQLPLFLGPNDGSDTLYVKPNVGGSVQAIYARVDDRLDANAARITALEAGAVGYRQFLYNGVL